MERLKVSLVAKKLGISPTAVYKKFRTSSELVQNHITKEKGVTYIDREGFELVKNSMRKAIPEPVSTGSELVQTLQKELDRKQTIIESLIGQQEEQRKRTDTILMKLTTDISNLQKALEYKVIEENPKTSEKAKPLQTKVSEPAAPIRANLPPVQREITLFESVRFFFDDVMGFVAGRG